MEVTISTYQFVGGQKCSDHSTGVSNGNSPSLSLFIRVRGIIMVAASWGQCAQHSAQHTVSLGTDRADADPGCLSTWWCHSRGRHCVFLFIIFQVPRILPKPLVGEWMKNERMHSLSEAESYYDWFCETFASLTLRASMEELLLTSFPSWLLLSPWKTLLLLCIFL